MTAVTVIRARRQEKGFVSHLSLENRLGNHAFGSGLPPPAIRMLASIAQPCDFKAGEYLWKQGDHAKVLYLIDWARSRLKSWFHTRDHSRSKPSVPGRSLGGHASLTRIGGISMLAPWRTCQHWFWRASASSSNATITRPWATGF